MVDKATAGKEDFEVGKTVGVQAEGPIERLRVSGIVQFGSGLTIGGATLAGFDLPTAQRLMRKKGQLDEIAVAAKADVTDSELVRQIEEILPTGTQVKTAGEQAQADAADTNDFITFLQGFLLAFGGIALFVGAFVIANSLSITIAQRTRELATLRTLGASRRQVLGSIFVEALVVGTVASVVGLFLGLLLAKGLFRLFDLVGFTLPNTGLVFLGRTVVVALAAGILVTLLASLRPAIRATRVPPIAAVREGAELPPGSVPPLPRGRRTPHRSRRVRGARLRPLRERPRDNADPGLDGARRAAHLLRRRPVLVASRPPACIRARLAGGRASGARPEASRETTRAGTPSAPARRLPRS